jgi:hypothetical protein
MHVKLFANSSVNKVDQRMMCWQILPRVQLNQASNVWSGYVLFNAVPQVKRTVDKCYVLSMARVYRDSIQLAQLPIMIFQFLQDYLIDSKTPPDGGIRRLKNGPFPNQINLRSITKNSLVLHTFARPLRAVKNAPAGLPKSVSLWNKSCSWVSF